SACAGHPRQVRHPISLIPHQRADRGQIHAREPGAAVEQRAAGSQDFKCTVFRRKDMDCIMKNGFEISAVIPASPAEIYEAWLSTKGHTSMTGSPARVSGKV